MLNHLISPLVPLVEVAAVFVQKLFNLQFLFGDLTVALIGYQIEGLLPELIDLLSHRHEFFVTGCFEEAIIEGIMELLQ